MTPRCRIELYNNAMVPLGDISQLCHDRSWSETRNNSETFTCSIDLQEFEKWCAAAGKDPRTLLAPGASNLKIKYDGVYLPFLLQIEDATVVLDTNEPTISIRAVGWLNLLKDRYITASYVNQEAASIPQQILAASQALPNGSLGITYAASPYTSGVLRTRTYYRDEVKLAIQRLSRAQGATFDFRLDQDRVWHVYEQIGSVRTDFRLVYGKNITRAKVERSSMALYNTLYGLGSGFGADQLVSDPTLSTDTDSQISYLRREKPLQYSSVVEQSTLDQNTAAALAASRGPAIMPVITLTGAQLPSNPLVIGDRVFVDLTAYKLTSDVYGYYRIEKMDTELDDNDYIKAVTLYFSDLGVAQDELA